MSAVVSTGMVYSSLMFNVVVHSRGIFFVIESSLVFCVLD